MLSFTEDPNETTDSPRVVHQSTALFLVTPQGDLWRIFDSDKPDGDLRSAPTSDQTVWARIFIRSGQEPAVRIYRFQQDETRSIDAEHLWQQLKNAKVGDERHA